MRGLRAWPALLLAPFIMAGCGDYPEPGASPPAAAAIPAPPSVEAPPAEAERSESGLA